MLCRSPWRLLVSNRISNKKILFRVVRRAMGSDRLYQEIIKKFKVCWCVLFPLSFLHAWYGQWPKGVWKYTIVTCPEFLYWRWRWLFIPLTSNPYSKKEKQKVTFSEWKHIVVSLCESTVFQLDPIKKRVFWFCLASLSVVVGASQCLFIWCLGCWKAFLGLAHVWAGFKGVHLTFWSINSLLNQSHELSLSLSNL